MVIISTFTNAKTVVFVSFESEFSPCGGLTAVMRHLPRSMIQKKPSILITPFFAEIEKAKEAYYFKSELVPFIDTEVSFANNKIPIKILLHEENYNGSIFKIYTIYTKKFFFAPINPYINPGNPKQLFNDVLFFCNAIPAVLRQIPEEDPFIIHLQDWETALVAETIKQLPKFIKATCFLTLHNPYDHSLTLEDLYKLTLTEYPTFLEAETVLKYTLSSITTLSTVSKKFAEELYTEPLMTEIFVPHLQDIFKKKRIYGIENGNFFMPKFGPQESLTGESINNLKIEARKNLLTLLESGKGQELQSKSWGKCNFKDQNIPLFFLFGRDDPRQKGYDIAVDAIRSLLTKYGTNYAHFVFTIIPSAHGIESLFYIRKLANEFPTAIRTYPFRMDIGYNELQSSSTYLLMPSFYEPFGGATEGYANGLPVVARATGGLIQQVNPKNVYDLPKEIQSDIRMYHEDSTQYTGFLFRETFVNNVAKDWKQIIDADYLSTFPPGDVIESRKHITLFNAMSTALVHVLEQAVTVYKETYSEYVQLILNSQYLLKKFSWDHAVDEYATKLYSNA